MHYQGQLERLLFEPFGQQRYVIYPIQEFALRFLEDIVHFLLLGVQVLLDVLLASPLIRLPLQESLTQEYLSVQLVIGDYHFLDGEVSFLACLQKLRGLKHSVFNEVIDLMQEGVDGVSLLSEQFCKHMTGPSELTPVGLHNVRCLNQLFKLLAFNAHETLLSVIVVHDGLLLMLVTGEFSVQRQILHEAFGPGTHFWWVRLLVLVELSALEDALEAACPLAERGLPALQTSCLLAT